MRAFYNCKCSWLLQHTFKSAGYFLTHHKCMIAAFLAFLCPNDVHRCRHRSDQVSLDSSSLSSFQSMCISRMALVFLYSSVLLTLSLVDGALTLPPACNPETSPVIIHATRGRISLGSRGWWKRSLQSEEDDDDVENAGNDDYSAPSAVPSVVPGQPGPFLPLGTRCAWIIDAGAQQTITANWLWSHISSNPPSHGKGTLPNGSPWPCSEDPMESNVLVAAAGPDASTLYESCWYDPSWRRRRAAAAGPMIVSTAGQLSVVLEIGAGGTATGFELEFAVGPASHPSPSHSPASASASHSPSHGAPASRSPAHGATKSSTPSALPNEGDDDDAVSVDCMVSDWGTWGACSKSCGGGQQTRTRSVVQPPSGEGAPCPPLEESRICNAVSCQPQPDQDCVLSPWSTWSACAAHAGACGPSKGQQQRSRSIVTPASGDGLPCPDPQYLLQSRACDAPCMVPACNATLRPVHPGAPAGTIGIGFLPAFPARDAGNKDCQWALDPTAPGWTPAGSTGLVQLNLTALNVPTSSSCVAGYLRVLHLRAGDAAVPDMCGSVVPQGSKLIASRPGDGLLVRLVTPDGDPLVGFTASYSLSLLPTPSPLPSASAPPSASSLPKPARADQTAATVTVMGGSTAAAAWGRLTPVSLEAQARADLSAATGAPPYRFTAFVYTPAAGQSPPLLTFQVVVPVRRSVRLLQAVARSMRVRALAGSATPTSSSTPAPTQAVPGSAGEPSVMAILQRLQGQVGSGRYSGSPLARGVVTSALDGSYFTTVWATPASVSFAPSSVAMSVPYHRPNGAGPGTYVQEFKVSNAGGSPLVVTGIDFTPAGGSGSPYGTSLFSLYLPPTFPFTLAGSTGNGQHAEQAIRVTLDPRLIKGDAVKPAFAVINVHHSDPDGPWSVPLTLTIDQVPLPSPPAPPSPAQPGGPAGIQDMDSFKTGAAVGAGGLVGSVFMLVCCYCCCCRRLKDGTTMCGRCYFVLRADPKAAAAAARAKASAAAAKAAAAKKEGASKDSDKVEIELAGGGGDERETASLRLAGGGGGQVATGAIELPSLQPAKAAAAGGGSVVTTITSGGAGAVGGGALFGGLSVTGSGGSASAGVGGTGTTTGTALPTGTGGGAGEGSQAQAGGATRDRTASSAIVALKSKPSLKAAEFESAWARLSTLEVWGTTLAAVPGAGELEKALAPKGIACMASGTVGGVTKYYFYAQPEASLPLPPGEPPVVIAEVSLTAASCRLSAIIKGPEGAAGGQLGQAFTEAFKAALAPLSKPAA